MIIFRRRQALNRYGQKEIYQEKVSLNNRDFTFQRFLLVIESNPADSSFKRITFEFRKIVRLSISSHLLLPLFTS